VKRSLAASAVILASLFILSSVRGEDRTMNDLQLSSPAFSHNGMIPAKFTCDGADASPPLAIGGVPERAASLTLIVDDPDAPARTWAHWVVWNVEPRTRGFPEGGVPRGARQGTNDFGKRRYGGPCPPSGTHRYFFKLYALDAALELADGATKAQVEEAMRGHVVAQAELIGLYRRK
jgi:Raf kinase inhibitor-like YbhB/YbcL family protein